MTVLWIPRGDLPDVEPPTPPGPVGNLDGLIYAPYTLAATWRTLVDRITIGASALRVVTPRDNHALIESVYGPAPAPAPAPAPEQVDPCDPLGALVTRTHAAWLAELANESNNATGRAFRPYRGATRTAITAAELASGSAHGNGDGRHTGVPGIAALSRLGEPTTDVVVLFRQPGGAFTYDAAGTLRADLRNRRSPKTDEERTAHRAQQRDLLFNTFALPDRWCGGGFGAPGTWPRLAFYAVRYRPTVVFDPSGTCVHGPVGRLTYNPLTGIDRTSKHGA